MAFVTQESEFLFCVELELGKFLYMPVKIKTLLFPIATSYYKIKGPYSLSVVLKVNISYNNETTKSMIE